MMQLRLLFYTRPKKIRSIYKSLPSLLQECGVVAFNGQRREQNFSRMLSYIFVRCGQYRHTIFSRNNQRVFVVLKPPLTCELTFLRSG